ncbi:MAG: CBS domain-containing protein [Candidatus Izemoplasmatales bacterium]
MDILSFMKPLTEVVFVRDDSSIADALSVFKRFRYQSIPVVGQDGSYAGSLSEGDLLYAIADAGNKLATVLKTPIGQIPRNRQYEAISVQASVNSLIGKAANENFVPIVDDAGKLLGIVTRKTLLGYFFEHQFIVL